MCVCVRARVSVRIEEGHRCIARSQTSATNSADQQVDFQYPRSRIASSHDLLNIFEARPSGNTAREALDGFIVRARVYLENTIRFYLQFGSFYILAGAVASIKRSKL